MILGGKLTIGYIISKYSSIYKFNILILFARQKYILYVSRFYSHCLYMVYIKRTSIKKKKNKHFKRLFCRENLHVSTCVQSISNKCWSISLQNVVPLKRFRKISTTKFHQIAENKNKNKKKSSIFHFRN